MSQLTSTWIGVRLARSRLDQNFLVKSVLPMFNAVVTSGIAEWPYYSSQQHPSNLHIWLYLNDMQSFSILRPAIEEHFEAWLDCSLSTPKLSLQYKQCPHLGNYPEALMPVMIKLYHLISITCLQQMHYKRYEWTTEYSMHTAVVLSLLIVKNTTTLDTEAICMLEQFYKASASQLIAEWPQLTRMQQIEALERERARYCTTNPTLWAVLRQLSVKLWNQRQIHHESPAIQRFANLCEVLGTQLKQQLQAAHIPRATHQNWRMIHQLLEQVHNNLLHGARHATMSYALLPQAIQQATSQLS